MRTIPICFFVILISASLCEAQVPSVLVEDYRFGAFTSAASLSCDPFNHVYITDAGSNTVVKHELSGKLLRSMGGQGWGADQFDHPGGIDAHLGISIYVADTWNHRIVHLDRQLSTVATFSTRSDPDQTMGFGYPLDVANSNAGAFFILDGENYAVARGTNFSRIDARFGGVDAGDGRLRAPVAMSVGPDDALYVLDEDRVVVFDAFGNLTAILAEGAIAQPKGLWVDESGVWIASSDVLLYLALDGRIIRKWTKQDFAFARPASEFRDVALTGGRLLLLTADCVIVFPAFDTKAR